MLLARLAAAQGATVAGVVHDSIANRPLPAATIQLVAADSIGRLQADIAKERDKIRTLNAEWSFLNQPSRLAALVQEHADYFQLQPFTPDQVAAIDEIPMRNQSAGEPAATTAINDAMVKATLARIAAGGALREH